MGDDSGSEASDGSSEGGLFGAAASWMEGQEEEGTADVGGVQRSDTAEDVDRSGHENWVFKKQEYWEERFGKEEQYDWLTGCAASPPPIPLLASAASPSRAPTLPAASPASRRCCASTCCPPTASSLWGAATPR